MKWPNRREALRTEYEEIRGELISLFAREWRLGVLLQIVEFLECEWQDRINDAESIEARGIRRAIEALKDVGNEAEAAVLAQQEGA